MHAEEEVCWRMIQLKQISLMAWILFLLIEPIYQLAQADIVVQKPKSLVSVKVESEINTKQPVSGQAFVIALNNTLIYPEVTLPQGTQLIGSVMAIKSSKKLGRPAWFSIRFDKIIFPNQTELLLNKVSAHAEPDVVIQPNRQKTFRYFVVQNLLLQNASVLVSGPLSLTTHMGIAMFNLVDTGVGIAMGAGYGVWQSRRRGTQANNGQPLTIDKQALTPADRNIRNNEAH